VHVVTPLTALGPIKCAASDTRFDEPRDDVAVVHGIGREGDLVLVEALASSGAYRDVENLDGRSMRIHAGQRFIAVLGHRESSQCLVGGVPQEGTDTREAQLHLLTNGGIVGTCRCWPGYMGPPLPLTCLGLLCRDGRTINAADRVQRWCPELTSSAPIVLVAATAAEAGKTTLSARIISGLSRRHGMRVAGTKLAGTGCLEDVLQHLDAGARRVLDFPDVGLPSTYTAPERYVPAIRTLLERLNEDALDVIVGELGGDFIWANIPTLLQTPDVMRHVVGMALLPLDVVAGIGAIRLLEDWGVAVPVHVVVPHLRNPEAARLRIRRFLERDAYDVTSERDMTAFVEVLAAAIEGRRA
jgi:hypothetical protein